MNNRYLFLVPLLIIVYFFIHNTLENFYFLNPGLIAITIAKYFIIIAALFFAGYAFFKNRIKFTFIFSGLLFMFLFFGNIADTIDKYLITQSSFFLKILRESLLGSLFIVVLILPKFWNQIKLKKFISFWIIYCSTLIVYDTFHFIAFPPKEKKYFSKAVKNINLDSAASKPDVFFLLFDMYPSDSIFKNYLHFDNHALRDFLNQKGFYTSSNSTSLYDHTFHSLSSTLNLDTLDYYYDSSLAEYKKNLISIKKTENSLLINSFKNAGYEINNYSVFKLDNKSSPLKFNLESYIGNNYTASTLFNRIYNNFDPDGFETSKRIPFLNFIKSSWSDDVQRDNAFLYKSFENILQQQTKPAFNYFHFEIPHPPFIFDSSGNLQNLKSMYETSDVNKRIERYVSYTKYGNQLITKMITKILERYNGNAVIILQGDHGYREYANIFPEQVRNGILNAVYLPSKNYDNFHDSMQPVYTFKQILKNQFKTTVN